MKTEKSAIHIEYKKEIAALGMKNFRIACLIGMISIPAFGLLDKIVVPDKFPFFMTLRVVEVIFLTILLLLSYSRIEKKIYLFLQMSAFVSASFIFCIMIKMNGGHTSTYYAGLSLVILTLALTMPWSIKETGLVCFLIYMLYLLAITDFKSPLNIPILVNNNMFFLCTIVIALITSYLSDRLRFREFTGRYELKKAMEALKFIALSLGHEIKNPLTPIRTKIQQLKEREDLKDDAFIQKLTAVVPYEIDRITRLLGQLKEFAAPASLDIEQINISDVLNDRLNPLKETFSQRNIQLIKKYDNFTISGDKDKLGQVFLNLFQNAIDAMPQGGSLTVSCENSIMPGQDKNAILIKVQDTGFGISKEDLSKIFDPFFSKKKNGTGLGLAVSHQIIKKHNGTIQVDSIQGKGTTFSLYLLI